VELVPFRAGIDAGAQVVDERAHRLPVYFSRATAPATLSASI